MIRPPTSAQSYAGEYVLLTLRMPVELGAPVEADLANVADSWQQLCEQRQFTCALVRELGMKAECGLYSGASLARAEVPGQAEGVVVTEST